MNKVILIGRLVSNPESVGSGGNTAKFRLAVDRGYKKDNGPSADYIPCISFGNNADFAMRYLKKGTKIALEGHLQSGSYERDGKMIYTLDVVVDRMEFVESKGHGGNYSAPAQETHAIPSEPTPSEEYPSVGDFALLEDEDESELPF